MSKSIPSTKLIIPYLGETILKNVEEKISFMRPSHFSRNILGEAAPFLTHQPKYKIFVKGKGAPSPCIYALSPGKEVIIECMTQVIDLKKEDHQEGKEESFPFRASVPGSLFTFDDNGCEKSFDPFRSQIATYRPRLSALVTEVTVQTQSSTLSQTWSIQLEEK